MDRVVGELQRRALELRTTPLLRIVEPLPRAAREVAERAGKRVEVELRGAELELDRSILDRLSDPLVHLLRNAVDHGIESPAERVAARQAAGRAGSRSRRGARRDTIRISVSRRRRRHRPRARCARARSRRASCTPTWPTISPPEQIAALVFEPGLSTAEHVIRDLGPRRRHGRGAHHGRVARRDGRDRQPSAAAAPPRRSCVPITAAVQRVLLLGVGGETVALPIAKVERILELPDSSASSAAAPTRSR